MNNLIKYFWLLIGILLLMNKSFGQDEYYTLSGNMLITAVINEKPMKITNKELLIRLNYETAEFLLKIDKSNFKTGIDSLDKKLEMLKYDIVEYKGKFGLDNINTNGHPPLDFEAEGVLSTNSEIIKGEGHLEHIANRGQFSCLLTLKFLVPIEDLGIEINLEGLEIKDDLQIEVVHTVLNKIQDQ